MGPSALPHLQAWQWSLLAFLCASLLAPIALGLGVAVDLENSRLQLFSSVHNPLGTDALGRDLWAVFSRGGIETILFALPARLVTLLAAALLLSPQALSAQVDAGRFSAVVALLPDGASRVLQIVPSLLLALVLSGILPSGGGSLFLAVVLSDWPAAHRSGSALLEEISGRESVTATVAMGAGTMYRLKVHIYPDFLAFMGRLFITGLPGVILTVSTLAFLGVGQEFRFLGVESWGAQIAQNRNSLLDEPRLILVPATGLAMLILALSPMGGNRAAGARIDAP